MVGKKKAFLVAGCAFTGFVIALLGYMHLSNAEQVEEIAHWDHSKSLYICDAPQFVLDSYRESLDLLEGVVEFGAIVEVDGPCSILPDVEVCVRNDGRTIPCVPGSVLLTSADSSFSFGDLDGGGHGDEALVSHIDGVIDYVTVMFPVDLSVVEAVNMEFGGEVEALRGDVDVLVVAHALVHSEGYGHVFTSLPGGVSAEKSGHLMSSQMRKLGRDLTGLGR